MDLRLDRVLDDAVPGWRDREGRADEVGLRPVDAGGQYLVIAHVPNAAERPAVVAALRRHFPDVPFRF